MIITGEAIVHKSLLDGLTGYTITKTAFEYVLITMHDNECAEQVKRKLIMPADGCPIWYLVDGIQSYYRPSNDSQMRFQVIKSAG